MSLPVSEPSHASTAQQETRSRILDAAEELFANQGFSAVSLRQITAHAGVNLASVNYHFGSKESLIFEVFLRMVGPINEERLRLLDEAEAECGEDPVPIERVLRCMFLPVLSQMKKSEHSRQVFLRLAGRCMSEEGGFSPEAQHETFKALADRFFAAAIRSLPHLSEAEIYWRFHFTVGVKLYALTQAETLTLFAGDKVDPQDIDAILEQMIAFSAAGMTAPSLLSE